VIIDSKLHPGVRFHESHPDRRHPGSQRLCRRVIAGGAWMGGRPALDLQHCWQPSLGHTRAGHSVALFYLWFPKRRGSQALFGRPGLGKGVDLSSPPKTTAGTTVPSGTRSRGGHSALSQGSAAPVFASRAVPHHQGSVPSDLSGGAVLHCEKALPETEHPHAPLRAARPEAYLGLTYARRRRRSRVCFGTTRTCESIDHFEDLFTLGSGNAAHHNINSRYEICKRAGDDFPSLIKLSEFWVHSTPISNYWL
jgi:hypothetical protein